MLILFISLFFCEVIYADSEIRIVPAIESEEIWVDPSSKGIHFPSDAR